MEITIEKNGILIVPETKFEEDYLSEEFSCEKELKVFLKHGMSTNIVVGLKITKEK